MNYINRIELAGVVVGTPELIRIGEKLKLSFTMRTEYAYHNRNGEAVIEKNFHRCNVWESSNISSDTLRKVTPGCKVHVTGRERTTYITRGEEKVKDTAVQASKFNLVKQSEPFACETQL